MTKKYKILFAILAAIATIQIVMAAPEVVPLDPSSSPVTDNEGGIRTFSARIMDAHFFDSNVSVYKNGTLVQYNASVPAGGRVDYTSIAIAGTWEINMTACNDSCSSYLWLWTVNDTTPPAVTSNTNNVRVANGSIVTLNATITDAGSGVKNATVNVSKINSTRNTVALTNQSGFWLASVVADKVTTGYENLNIVAYDNAGNVNNSVGMTVWVDGVAPGNVTNLTNSTYAQTHINSTWDDPVDADLDHVEVYANDTFKQNVSKGTKFYNLTGLSANTQYNISVRPIDSVGNPGNWTNYSATTAPEPTPTPTATATPAPSTGGGGSSGSGGGGVVSSEPAANIEKYKRVDGSLIANTPVTFSINLPEIPVSEFVVTGKENQNDVTFRVDALRGMAKDVTIPPQGVPYKHLIISENSKRIKEAVIRFKVENSWLASNNFDGKDVVLERWNEGKWNMLKTSVKSEDNTYTYFEAETPGFSPFAIVGVKKPAEVAVTAVAPALTATPAAETAEATETPVAEQNSSVRNALMVSLALVVIVVCVLVALVRRQKLKT